MIMLNASNVPSTLRALSVDELDQVSGGKGKKAFYVTVERCTTTVGPGGKETQTCKTVSETIL
jgi:hypothetical protein